jgi:hypothetical protein
MIPNSARCAIAKSAIDWKKQYHFDLHLPVGAEFFFAASIGIGCRYAARGGAGSGIAIAHHCCRRELWAF